MIYLLIQIKNDEATYSETPVEISGSEDALKKAKEFIEKIVHPESSLTDNMGGTVLRNHLNCSANGSYEN